MRVWRLAPLSLSLVELVAGLAGVVEGGALLHAGLVSSALLGFYGGVAVGYISSLARGSRLVEALLLAHALLYTLSWLHPLAYAAASLLGLASTLYTMARARITVLQAGLSLLYSCGVAVAALSWLYGRAGVVLYLAYILAVPAAAIIVVNSYALVKTYGLRVPLTLALIPVALLEASALLLAAGSGAYRVASAAGFAVYALLLAAMAAGVPGSRVYRGARGVARESHRYLLLGELLAIPLSLAASLPADPLTLAHLVSIGYAGIHIAVHAPLMLPALLGVRAGRRYTPLPYLLVYLVLAARLLGAHPLITTTLALGYAASLVHASFELRHA